MKPTIVAALVGTGWAGRMHAASYQKLWGLDCRLKTVCSLEPGAGQFAEAYHFESWTADFEEVLNDPEIQIVDIAAPPAVHLWMVEQALEAGKDVICEKPLTGYFGQGEERPGDISRKQMLEYVSKTLNALEKKLDESGRTLYYAENWIYSPSFVRALDLIIKKKTTLVTICGQTGHKGSHAAHAAIWKANGGGALIRQGTHPVAAALYLKRKEMEARGENYGVASVLCDCACIAGRWEPVRKRALHTRSMDVEDWAQVVITFSDGTKASILAGDLFLSQIYNRMELFGNDAVYRVNMTPNNLLEAYFSDDIGIQEEEIMEKNDQNVGWHQVLVEEALIRGYVGQLQDFLECSAYGREPRSGLRLAKETLLVIYAAYYSAEIRRAVDMKDWIV
ncbi:MAG: Gfo/Idh/MocA family oxidoreductase [Lachnospiraceae bacterium]|nr:Gfo/Idh/MocA family oxidoreductase [Lachnospiraceae bacterium]